MKVRIVLVYAVLGALFAAPVLIRLGSVLPHDAIDPVLNTWILWWGAQTTPLTDRWWDAPAFHPASGALACSEHLAGLALLAAPVQWLGGSPVLAYDLLFVLAAPLCGIAAHALAHALTGRHDAALLAGLAYAFAPYRLGQLAHLQVLAAWGLPLVLLGLHRYLADGERRWLALAASTWLWQGLINGYYLLLSCVLLALWLGWFGTERTAWRRLPGVAFAFGLAVLPAVPFLMGYRSRHARQGFAWSWEEVERLSPDGSAFLARPALALLAPPASPPPPEAALEPGLLPCLLVALGLQSALRRSSGRWRAAGVLALVGLGFALVALGAVTLGPWRASLLGIPVSVTVPEKPLSLAVLSLAGATVASPPFAAAFRRRSTFAFYTSAASVFALLALGPRPRILGRLVLYQPPFALLQELPGFSALRVPGRVAMLMVLCLALAAALAVGRMLADGKPRRTQLALLAAAMVAWGWPARLPLAELPPRTPLLESLADRDAAVLELPAGGREADLAAMYRGIFHGRRVVNGSSGFEPAHYEALRGGLAAGDPSVLAELAADGPLLLRLELGHPDRGALVSLVLAAGARPLASDAAELVYRLPRTARAAAEPGARLSLRSVQASLDPNAAPRLLDGDLRTRWSTGGPQRGGEWLAVELGESRLIASALLALGPSRTDWPRELEVQLLEGDAWRTAFRGPTAALALRGGLAEPARLPILVPLTAGPPVQRLRLVQHASHPVWYWSVAELEIRGPAR